MSKIDTIEFKDKNGQTVTLKDFNAKAFLIVNVASKCGLTPQYEGLQAMYKEFKTSGLEILAFPANEFLGQEPGTNDEIQSFCSLTYNVTFPVNEKIIVKGEGQHALYKELTNADVPYIKNEDGEFEKKLTDKGLITGTPKDIKWNFEKFLVSQDGTVLARFFPDITASDSRLVEKVKELL